MVLSPPYTLARCSCGHRSNQRGRHRRELLHKLGDRRDQGRDGELATGAPAACGSGRDSDGRGDLARTTEVSAAGPIRRIWCSLERDGISRHRAIRAYHVPTKLRSLLIRRLEDPLLCAQRVRSLNYGMFPEADIRAGRLSNRANVVNATDVEIEMLTSTKSSRAGATRSRPPSARPAVNYENVAAAVRCTRLPTPEEGGCRMRILHPPIACWICTQAPRTPPYTACANSVTSGV